MIMVDYLIIENILSNLDTLYSVSIGSADATIPASYCKLAVLELGGWIEESVDLMLFNYIDNKLCSKACIARIKEIIRKNYGFKYNENLVPLFMGVLGANNWENIVDSIGDAQIAILSTMCGNYTNQRNDAAHTYQLVTHSYCSPSSVRNDFHQIKPIIEKIENEILKLI